MRVENLISGICTLKKETPEWPLTPSTMRGHSQEMAVRERGHGSSPDFKSASVLTAGFSASGTVRWKFVLLISHIVSGALLQQPDGLR